MLVEICLRRLVSSRASDGGFIALFVGNQQLAKPESCFYDDGSRSFRRAEGAKKNGNKPAGVNVIKP